MKKGINVWAFPESYSLEEILQLAQACGFEALELSYGLDGPLTAETTDAEAAALAQRCRDAGIDVSSLASGIFWKVNLLSDDADERTAAKGHIRQMLRLGHVMKVTHLLVVPGFVGPFEAGAPVIADYMSTYERALADFHALAEAAAEADVIIGLETVWNKFLTSPLEARAFIDAIGSPYVGIYLDVGNVLRTGYPEHWIQVLQERICGVHLKDFKAGVGNLQGFIDLLRGDVDFKAVMDALRAVGYDDSLIVEMFPEEALAPLHLRQAAENVDHILHL